MGRSHVRFSAAWLAISLLAAACENSSTLVLEPNPATRVILDSEACPRVETCGTCLLRTEAFDKNGQPARFPTLVWSSSNPSLATVEQTGRVNGWRVGNVTIRVEVMETEASDDVVIPVVVNPLVPCNPPAARSPAPLVPGIS